MRIQAGKLKIASLTIITILFTLNAQAQLDPFGSMYFQNQYLGNPAMAGAAKGLDINLGVRKQWGSIPGSPLSQNLTATYDVKDRVSVGLNAYADQAGLFKNTRVVGTYAYSLPLGAENEHLRFGLSLGFQNQRISYEDVNGDAGDLNVSNYNGRETDIDGDFGLAYTGQKFTIQAALPNMKSVFKRDILLNTKDYATFYSAISYKLSTSDSEGSIGLEPKIAYRGVKGHDSIVDAGANLTFINSKLNFSGMYHSSQSASFGMGMMLQSFGVYGLYNTNTSALGNYTNGTFEVNLRLNLF